MDVAKVVFLFGFVMMVGFPLSSILGVLSRRYAEPGFLVGLTVCLLGWIAWSMTLFSA